MRLAGVAGKRDQDEHLPNTYTGAAPVNSVTGEAISLFDATRDTTAKRRSSSCDSRPGLRRRSNFVVGGFQQTNDDAFCVVQVLGFIDLVRPAHLPAAQNSTPQVLCNRQDSDSSRVSAT